MKSKLYKFLPRYLLYAFPAVVGTAIWSGFIKAHENPTGAVGILWEIMAWNLIIWFGALTLFILLLVLSKALREQILPKIVRMTERDERELQLTGRAARNSYLATIAAVFLLLFLTSFKLTLREIPQEQRVDGKSKQLSLALKFDGVVEDFDKFPQQVEFLDLPLTKQGILLLLLGWQIGSFAYFTRRRELEV